MTGFVAQAAAHQTSDAATVPPLSPLHVIRPNTPAGHAVRPPDARAVRHA